MPALNPELQRAHEIIMARYNDPNANRDRDYTKANHRDFRDMCAELQSAHDGGTLNETVLNTALGTTDFGLTYDLPLEEPDSFWDKIKDENLMLEQVETRFTSRQGISRAELTLGANGEDIWRPGIEGTDPGDTVTVDTAAQTFYPQEVIAIVDITDNVLEDNLEGQGLEAHLMAMIARATANEWGRALMNGHGVGSSNSDRSSITGCFDGWLQQYLTGGAGVVYATTFEDRLVSNITENDKHFAMFKSLPTKYDLQGKVILSPRDIIMDYAQQFADRQTALGDAYRQGGYQLGVRAQGVPFFECNAFRSDHLVKGTGTVQASSPVDTTVAAIAKSRQKDVTVASATNESTGNKYVVGCDAAGTSFELYAEKCTQNGAAVGSVITMAANLLRDHAIGEIFTEYSAFPDADGVPNLLTAFENLKVISHRVLRIEPYRLPRLRTTCFVLTSRICPAVLNPEDGVIIRDLLAL